MNSDLSVFLFHHPLPARIDPFAKIIPGCRQQNIGNQDNLTSFRFIGPVEIFVAYGTVHVSVGQLPVQNVPVVAWCVGTVRPDHNADTIVDSRRNQLARTAESALALQENDLACK